MYKYTFSAYGMNGIMGMFSFDYETDNPNQNYPNGKKIKEEMHKVYPDAETYLNIKCEKLY